MSVQTAEDFLVQLKQSGLVAAGLIEELDRKAGDGTAVDCAKRLIRDGLLTKWQSQQLLNGNYQLLQLGKFQLLDQLGAGGMGAVYKAHQLGIERTVAIKVMSKKLIADDGAVRRFLREAEAMASLQHPNIVTAFDAGNVGDVYFLVMEYVEGRDLSRWIGAQGRLPVAWSCECIRQAAAGLEHAHQRGLIHRDIKPGNLLVVGSLDDKPMVKVLDLGLARFTAGKRESTALTNTGQMMGTPDYMAPEQGLSAKTADIRADVYALGCTLYKMLTGTAPFQGGTPLEVMVARASNDPPHVCKLRSEVPPDLDAVLHKMMAREPANRFQTPGDVADALAPFCDRELNGRAGTAASAHDPGLRIRFDDSPREPMKLPTGATIVVDGNRESKHSDARAKRNTLITAVACLAVALLGLGIFTLWPSNAPGKIVVKVNQPQAMISITDPNGVKIERSSPSLRESMTIEVPIGEQALLIEKAGFEPYRTSFRIASAEERRFDVQLARAPMLPVSPVPPESIEPVQPPVSPTPAVAASGILRYGKLVHKFQVHDRPVHGLDVSPDGKLAACGSANGQLLLYDLENQREVARLAGHTGFVNNVKFSADGQTLVTGGDDQVIRLWDVTSHQSKAELRGHRNRVTDFIYLPNGETLVSSSSDATLRIWRSDNQVEVIDTKDRIIALKLSPPGDLLVGASLEGHVHQWSLPTMEPVRSYKPHQRCRCIAFSPDGSQLVTVGNKEQSAIVWTLATWRTRFQLPIQDDAINSAWFDSEGLLYAAGHLVDVWQVETGRKLGTLPAPDEDTNIFSHVFTSDGKWLLLGQGNGQVGVYGSPATN